VAERPVPLVVVIQPTRPSSLARAPPLVGVVRRETSETVTAAKRPVVRSGVTRARDAKVANASSFELSKRLRSVLRG